MKIKGTAAMKTNRQACGKTRLRSKKSRAQGFTLLEVMVVVVIIAVMAAAVAPSVMGKLEESRVSRAQTDLKNIKSMLELYKMENFQYPSTDQGLDALVTKPSGDPVPKAWQQHFEKTPMDPWENPYKYLQPGTHGAVDIYSLGPDGRQSDDDIGNWMAKN